MARIDQTRWQDAGYFARCRWLLEFRLDGFPQQQREVVLPPPPFRETAI